MPFDKSKFIEQFRTETREHLQNLSLGLIKLEKTPGDRELLNSLMREAHTIKGTAVMMGYKRISEIAHKMEDGLEKALKEGLTLTSGHLDLLLKCVDAINPLLEDKVTWGDTGVAGHFSEKLCAEVDAAFSGSNPAPAPQPEMKNNAEDAEARKATEGLPQEKIPGKAPEARGAAAATETSDTSIRVDTSRLDRLVNLAGEQYVARIRLGEVIKIIANKAESHRDIEDALGETLKDLRSVSDNIDLLASSIQSEIMNIRMVPVAVLFNTFPRAMRTLAREKGKEIDFELKGGDTALDKLIIDEMREPLMHLLRNTIDHGIETPDEREKAGKSRAGNVVLSAYQLGSQVVIEISDDGCGIDIEKVKSLALEKNILSQDRLEGISEEQILQIIFTPGFTTKADVSETSGRGVGLDVVREKVGALKGMAEVFSKPGKGSKFVIKLPLTLAITGSLLVTAGDDTFAVPIERVVETIRINQQDIKLVETKEAITVRGHILPLVRLTDLFGLPKKGIFEKNYSPVVIVQSIEKKIGLLVDSLLGHQDIVGKAIGDPLRKVANISGATILGSGKVILLLDIPSIIDSAEGIVVRRPAQGSAPVVRTKRKKTILLAEDAMTTAMLEKNILESVGYSVVLARDGAEALNKSSMEKFDLVITDVLMPRMDGFELTARLKKDSAYKDIPVIIVTTRETDADKKRGMEAGADAYLLKSEFTSDILLDTIERLL